MLIHPIAQFGQYAAFAEYAPYPPLLRQGLCLPGQPLLYCGDDGLIERDGLSVMAMMRRTWGPKSSSSHPP